MLTRVAVCAAMAGARLLELRLSQSNLAPAPELNEGSWSRRTFPGIVAVHTAVITGTLVFGSRQPRLPWLVLLLLVQPLRLWILLTLGRRWNARGVVAPDMVVETRGPYAFVRHPNYAIVAAELLSLPLAFGLRRLAIAASVVNAGLLAIRIREEEALLFQLPGYREHFERKPRFLPV